MRIISAAFPHRDDDLADGDIVRFEKMYDDILELTRCLLQYYANVPASLSFDLDLNCILIISGTRCFMLY